MKHTSETLRLDTIVGGGQTIGTLADGRRAFVWGGLPGELVTIRITKKKSRFVEGLVTEVHESSAERITPRDPDSYFSTSPWQIMTCDAERHYKAALIEEAFELHGIVLPDPIEVYGDGVEYGYRNKVEFSFFGQTAEKLDEEWRMRNDATASQLAAARTQSQPSLATFGDSTFPAEASQDKFADSSERAPNVANAEVANGNDNTTSYESDEHLDLAFFRRGSKGKITVDGTSLARDEINTLARAIRDLLVAKPGITARNLKTLLIRCDQAGNCVWQLYVKDKLPDIISPSEAATLPAQGGEVIYSDPRSPASRITERLARFGTIVLEDRVLGVPFRYATEGFFQVNIPVYEQALRDMQAWLIPSRSKQQQTATASTPAAQLSTRPEKGFQRSATPIDTERSTASDGRETHLLRDEEGGERGGQNVVDLYSGVGTIGLTIGGDDCTLIEIDENAVREMRRNITELSSNATAILAPSEKALQYITEHTTVIVDPPRAGLHVDVVARLLETKPPRIIYLSCNPVTQARDIALLCADGNYGIRAHRGYNFFPRTPHIEHLVILDIV